MELPNTCGGDLPESTNTLQLVENLPVFDWHHQVVFEVHQLCSQADESYDALPPRKEDNYHSRYVYQHILWLYHTKYITYKDVIWFILSPPSNKD